MEYSVRGEEHQGRRERREGEWRREEEGGYIKPCFPSPSQGEGGRKRAVHFPEGEICVVREFVPEEREVEGARKGRGGEEGGEEEGRRRRGGEEVEREEYLRLQEQLRRMKVVCERLKQTNLRQDLEQLQSTMQR